MIDLPATLQELGLEADLLDIHELTPLGGGERDFSVYRHDFVGFCVNELGDALESLQWSLQPEYKDHVWDGHHDPFIQASKAVEEGKDVGIESATGTGKTWWLSRLVLWFLLCWEDSIVVTAAPKQDQLLLHVWKEVGRVWPKFSELHGLASQTTGKIRMRGGTDESWAATAFVCGVGADEASATKAQGFHAEHMLIITEETPGIHSAIMAAFENTRTDEHNLHVAVGNPDSQSDELHTFCVRPSTSHLRISALDHPNVVTGKAIVPGAISRRRIEERAALYGDTSRLYKSRVRGISPAEAADALIKRIWCQLAADKLDRLEYRAGRPSLGVDVANSPNGDKAAIARGVGAACFEVESFPCEDSNELGRQVGAEMEVAGILPEHVGVDPGGVGAGCYNELKVQGYHCPNLNASNKARSEYDHEIFADRELKIRFVEVFRNFRAQMWWRMREDLRRGYIALPDDPELWDDLTTPEYRNKDGKILVEPKEDIVKRLGRSPDRGDAVVLWNWVRDRQVPRDEPVELPAESYDTQYHDVIDMMNAHRKRGRAF